MGGVERVMVNLANEFSANGYEVDVVVVNNRGVFKENVNKEVHIVDLYSKRVISALIPLIRYLRKEKPDAVISAKDYINILASIAAGIARMDTRLILTLHNFMLFDSFLSTSRYKVGIIRFMARHIYLRKNNIVAVSKAVAKDNAEFFGLPAEKIKVIYNPVITPQIFLLANSGKDILKKITGDTPFLVSAGRLAKEKDYNTLIKAFSYVLPQFPSKLIILGDGPEKDALRNLICTLGLEDSVLLCGYTDNPYVFIKNAEIFVLSSITEALPSVLIEALALETKVVSTDCGGAREILKDGRLGILSPIGDEIKLAQAIMESMGKTIVLHEDDLKVYTAAYSVREYIKLMSQ
jgi:glycosyltransferase involved in cell wall biosynthesis